MSFQTPEIPTSHNFDMLLEEFDGDAFGTENDLALRVESETWHATDTNETSRYQYKDLIQTSDGFLRLPAPLFFSWCAHDNPAGFLVNQAVKCNTMIQEKDCTTLPALSMEFYTNINILAVPNSSRMVNITIHSITVQTLDGLRTRLYNTDVLMLPTLHAQSCSNVVLEQNTHPIPLSGSPGYVVGQPVRAGFRSAGYPFCTFHISMAYNISVKICPPGR
ncbi:hypothetical protein JD844_015203 [Phrynosoma platyrhinos]|uniref:Tectonic-1-3 domain-containing protein n=1 Tax=Phrynosoma platyrhinos TaxID=52577 RepID=A0ABQ7T876_PHRPL|nr:hypothetical protein JD844_015203 [Phrynosoma platyrhinos]